MKKLSIVAVALCTVLLCAVPAMALETTFSGEWYVRGFTVSHNDP